MGDNDTMGALVAKYARADLLVVLSDIDGLYTADPHTHPEAKRIQVVEEITPEIAALAGGVHSGLGTGGMATKVLAARIATGAGVDMVIANGGTPPCCTTLWRENRWAPALSAGSNHTRKKRIPTQDSGPDGKPPSGPAIKEAFALTTHEILLAAQSARQPLALASTIRKTRRWRPWLWLWWPPGRRFWRQPPGSGCRPGQGVRGDAGPSGPDQHPPG